MEPQVPPPPPPAAAGGPQQPAPLRRIALVFHSWGHASTFFCWTWTKQYLLRRAPDGSIDPTERLFIVKAGKDDVKDDRWKVGGPLVPDLDTALARYPHTVVRLDGALKAAVRAFLEREAIDILVVSDHWPQHMLQLTSSVSEWVRGSVQCPFIIIRRNAVVNARMKISSQSQNPKSAAEGMLTRVSSPTAATTGRRVAIAYNSFVVGRGLVQLARDKVLSKADTIYICHVFPPNQNPVVKETMKVMRALTLQRIDSVSDEVTRDNAIDFGAAELEGYNVQLNVVLQGDPAKAIAQFCEAEEIELLVMGVRSGGKIRKKLSGGGVSSFLIDNAPCPCLVVPYRYMGVHIEEGRDTLDDEGEAASPTALVGLQPRGGSPRGGSPRGGSPRGGSPTGAARREGGHTEGVAAVVAAGGGTGGTHSTPSDLLAQLQRQLDDKDRTIAELRQQVHALQLAAAQRESAAAHDPAAGGHAV